MKPISYVTFDETGALTGAFLQEIRPEHEANHIVVDEGAYDNWTAYRANEARDGVELMPPAPPLPPEVPDYVAAVQGMLDAKARERRYDNILSACTYVTSTQPKFQAEGQACVAWRDAIWSRCYELMDQVSSGELSQPTVEDLLTMLPTMEWPE
jgi:hypothetical protein